MEDAGSSSPGSSPEKCCGRQGGARIMWDMAAGGLPEDARKRRFSAPAEAWSASRYAAHGSGAAAGCAAKRIVVGPQLWRVEGEGLAPAQAPVGQHLSSAVMAAPTTMLRSGALGTPAAYATTVSSQPVPAVRLGLGLCGGGGGGGGASASNAPPPRAGTPIGLPMPIEGTWPPSAAAERWLMMAAPTQPLAEGLMRGAVAEVDSATDVATDAHASTRSIFTARPATTPAAGAGAAAAFAEVDVSVRSTLTSGAASLSPPASARLFSDAATRCFSSHAELRQRVSDYAQREREHLARILSLEEQVQELRCQGATTQFAELQQGTLAFRATLALEAHRMEAYRDRVLAAACRFARRLDEDRSQEATRQCFHTWRASMRLSEVSRRRSCEELADGSARRFLLTSHWSAWCLLLRRYRRGDIAASDRDSAALRSAWQTWRGEAIRAAAHRRAVHLALQRNCTAPDGSDALIFVVWSAWRRRADSASALAGFAWAWSLRPRLARMAISGWRGAVAAGRGMRSAMDLAFASLSTSSSYAIARTSFDAWERRARRQRRGRALDARRGTLAGGPSVAVGGVEARAAQALLAWRLHTTGLRRAGVVLRIGSAWRGQDHDRAVLLVSWLLWRSLFEQSDSTRLMRICRRLTTLAAYAALGRGRLLLELVGLWRRAAAECRKVYWAAADLRWRSLYRTSLGKPWHKRSDDIRPHSGVVLACWTRWQRVLAEAQQAHTPSACAVGELHRGSGLRETLDKGRPSLVTSSPVSAVASPCRQASAAAREASTTASATAPASQGAEARAAAGAARRVALAEARRLVSLHKSRRVLGEAAGAAELRTDADDLDFADARLGAALARYEARQCVVRHLAQA
mmetsp:Transcript_159555/g.511993  ORF Transcript_159555/g.511993 Transcript_159555/m.511993 type:complete len:863 (-) Transcript_159555:9-2597(-)